MVVTGALVVAAATAAVSRRAGAVVAGAVFVLLRPLLGIAAAGLVIGIHRLRRIRDARRDRRSAAGDVALLAELVAMGLDAGLGVRPVLAVAATDLHPLLAAEVGEVAAAMDRDGSVSTLRAATGRASRVWSVLARSADSGAAAATGLRAVARALRSEEHAGRMAEARKLPVRLLVPVALLILPGFVVLAVGPALIGAVDRLGPLP